MSQISVTPWPRDDARAVILIELRRRIGEFMLVGAHARDIVCRDVVGLDRGMPSTSDLDVAVAISTSGPDYAQRVSGLEGRGTSSRMRFTIPDEAGVPGASSTPIDVIPYGPGVLDPANIPLDAERSLDATGMAEAASCAVAVQVRSDLVVSIPPLHALMALKLLAYGLRVTLGELKDARDLDLLLDATSRSPLAEDDCYAHASAAPAELDFDLDLIGPWLAGARAHRDFGEPITRRILASCTTALAGHVAGRPYAGVGAADRQLREAQLEAFVLGAGADPIPDLEPWPPRLEDSR